jgi:uncharacterized damage-inducible protein DinB
MNIQDINLLYDYNFWANRLIMAKSAEVTPEQLVAPTTHSWGSLRGTLVHLLDSEYGWRRIFETGGVMFDDLTPEDFPTVESVRQRWDSEEAAWRSYLSSLTDADMTRIIRYDLPEGGFRERVLWHCLFHVVNHGMQHRSEAAHMLTKYGHSPGDIDFTLYLRQR